MKKYYYTARGDDHRCYRGSVLASDERQALEKVQAIGFNKFKLRRSWFEVLTSCLFTFSRGVAGLVKLAVLLALFAGLAAVVVIVVRHYLITSDVPAHTIRHSEVAGPGGLTNGEYTGLRPGTHRYRNDRNGQIHIITCVSCRDCRETGITTCLQCAGFGALEHGGVSSCKRCRGRGSVNASFRVWNAPGGQRASQTTCPDCKGLGRVKTTGLNLKCPVCEGIGRQPCASCEGKGMLITKLDHERWRDRFMKFVKSLYASLATPS